MKIGKLLLGVVSSALIATSAMAADLPQAPTGAPPPPSPMAAPAFDWSGLYYGVSVGRIVGPIEGQVQVGYNVVRGRFLAGAEVAAGVLIASPVALSATANARLGLLLGDRALLYALAGVEYILGPAPLLWTARGGVEYAFSERVSVFGEAGVVGIFGGAIGPFVSFRAGVNLHR
jgi:opacity protein-like surface antigen